MSLHLDPSLVAGFAAEARSHLPQIKKAVGRCETEIDAAALEEAKRQVESMRDASSMVGIEPLGRVLELFVRKLDAPDPGALDRDLHLLDEYLSSLEQTPVGGADPLDLLEALAETSPAKAADGVGQSSPASSPGLDLPEPSGPPPLPMPSWVLGRGNEPSLTHALRPPVDGAAASTEPLDSAAVEPPTPKPPMSGSAAAESPIAGADLGLGEGLPAAPKHHLSPPARPEQEPSGPRTSEKKKRNEGPSAAIREIFAAESDEHAQAISKLLGELHPRRFSRDVVSNLRRRVHNLKGSAALVKLEDLSRVAHGMEDLLDVFYEQSRGPSTEELSALELAGDALQALIYDRELSVEVPTVMATLAGAEPPAVAAEPARGEESRNAPFLRASSLEASPLPKPPLLDQRPAQTPWKMPSVAETAAVPAKQQAEADVREIPVAVDVASPDPGPGEDTADPPERVKERQRYVRVSVDALDEAMRLLVEVETERYLLRSLIAKQKDHSVELDLADRRLQHEVRALETDLEVAALGGTGLLRSNPPADSDSPFDALELDRYSELHERSRSLIESAGDLETVRADLGGQLVSMDHSIERLEGTAGRLRDRLLGLRLVPFSSLVPRLEGVVRLAARTAGKEARLAVDDGGVELDKDVLDALMDPLDHLLRNAVAHGIESPAARSVAGKGEMGDVRLVARYGPEGVRVTLSDDGGGINVEAVGRRALERGLRSASELEALGTDGLRELIFEPGLSTAAEVDQLAGRGIGMDVVRQRLGELRGRLAIDSSTTEGTAFRLELPTTLAVQRVLLVTDQGHRLALPSSGLERLERVAPERVEVLAGKEILRTAEEVFHVVRLARAVGFPAKERESGEHPVAIFSRLQDRPTAFLVDEIHGGHEVVVQDLGRHLGRRPGLIGVTQFGTGHPVPILDPVVWQEGASDARRVAPLRAEVAVPKRLEVLVVDDSLSMRRYLRQLVDRFGFLGIESRDGRDAMELLDSGNIEPSLILLDLEMPRMDGFELMSALRLDGRFAAVPRAVLTSRDAAKHRNRAFEAGADAYLVKPVAEDELEATLRQLTSAGVSI